LGAVAQHGRADLLGDGHLVDALVGLLGALVEHHRALFVFGDVVDGAALGLGEGRGEVLVAGQRLVAGLGHELVLQGRGDALKLRDVYVHPVARGELHQAVGGAHAAGGVEVQRLDDRRATQQPRLVDGDALAEGLVAVAGEGDQGVVGEAGVLEQALQQRAVAEVVRRERVEHRGGQLGGAEGALEDGLGQVAEGAARGLGEGGVGVVREPVQGAEQHRRRDGGLASGGEGLEGRGGAQHLAGGLGELLKIDRVLNHQPASVLVPPRR
jgi:hypothetical protein